MTEAKFTPGPWSSSGQNEYTGQSEWVYGGPHRARIAQAEFGLDYGQDIVEETAANAHLIAAAPDMYAALEAYTKAYDETSGTIHVNDKVRAALAKARGE